MRKEDLEVAKIDNSLLMGGKKWANSQQGDGETRRPVCLFEDKGNCPYAGKD